MPILDYMPGCRWHTPSVICHKGLLSVISGGPSVPKPAAPPPPAVMPTPDDAAVTAAKNKQAAAVASSSGRAATILSDSSDKLGG